MTKYVFDPPQLSHSSPAASEELHPLPSLNWFIPLHAAVRVLSSWGVKVSIINTPDCS